MHTLYCKYYHYIVTGHVPQYTVNSTLITLYRDILSILYNICTMSIIYRTLLIISRAIYFILYVVCPMLLDTCHIILLSPVHC